MSWFTRAISNTLNLDEEDEDYKRRHLNESTDNGDSTNTKHEQQVEDDDSPLSPSRGVKEDLSEITETLTRRFWGVASFLAPPPQQQRSDEQSDPSDPESEAPEAVSGLRRDFAEIGGRFRSGISKLSSNIDVTEITKMASTFLQLESKDEDYHLTTGDGAIGVTDEVVDFVRDVTMHPETWLDFPLQEDEDADEDFELSDAQYEHAVKIERLAPELSALRIELCPSYMSESFFWKIYFVLLYPRLERHAAELLSTPEIVKARASLTQELKSHSNSQSKQEELINTSFSENLLNSTQEEPLSVPSRARSDISARQATDSETLKDKISIDQIQIENNHVNQKKTENETKSEDRNVNPTTDSSAVEDQNEDDDGDDWLKEESSETVPGLVPDRTTVSIENDEDVSFSDLEEDDGDVSKNENKTENESDFSTIEHTGSKEVSSENPDTNESNDWLDVDDIDIA